MDLDQAFNSALQISKDSSIHPFQPFDSLPDEVLLLLLDPLTPFQRCLVLSICKKWNQVILGHKRWWQYLDVPEHLPFSTALSILQIFNSRSNFTLRHVILQPIMETSKEVDEVFVELEKSSSGHVKLLFLNQSGFTLAARRAAQKSLPNLNTLWCTHTPNVKQALKSMSYQRDVTGILDEVEEGLQFLDVAELHQLEAVDLEWCSKLKYLSVDRTDSVKDLHHILEVSKGTLRRLRLDLWTFDKNLEEPELLRADGFQKISIKLPDLETFFIPSDEYSAAALGRLIDFEGQEWTLFIAFIHSLLQFDFLSLEQVCIRIYEKDVRELGLDEEEAKTKTLLFFEGNPSIFHLGLHRVAGPEDRESFHLDFILHSLSTKRNSGSSDESKRESQSSLLPKLRCLVIETPHALNKKLLKQFWETRKAIQEDFQILVYIEGVEFSIDRSGGENWLDEAGSCECSGSRSSQVLTKKGSS